MKKTTKSKATKPDPAVELLHQCQRDLTQYKLNLDEERDRYEKLSRYHRVAIGLSLIIARSIYKVPNDGSRGNQHKEASVDTAQDSTASESVIYEKPISFEHFLETIQWLPRRTAYAYIKAAENLGLDETSTQADITKLRKAKALHALTAKEWAALCGTGAKDKDPVTVEPEKPQGVFSFYKEALHGITEHGKTLSTIRANLDPTAYATTCAVLQKELEKLTGQCWEPNAKDADPNHYKALWPEADLESIGL